MTDDEYAEIMDRLVAKANTTTQMLVSQIDWSDDFDVIRSKLEGIYDQVASLFGEASSFLAAEKYDLDRLAQELTSAYRAHPIDSSSSQQAAVQAASKAIGAMINSGVEAAGRVLGTKAATAVQNTAHNTVASNAAADPAKPRYSVHLRCQLGKCRKKNKPAWHCDNVARMVENLKAGEKPDNWFHPNCNCTVTANWTDGKTRFVHRNHPDAQILDNYYRDVESARSAPVTSMAMNFDRTTTAIANVPAPRPAHEFAIPAYQLTADDLRHITLGEVGGQGGHLFDIGRDGKTEFPQNWSREKIEAAAQAVFDAPQWADVRDNADGGKTIRRYGLVDDVLIVARTRVVDGVETLVHVYPVGGTGIVKNIDGEQVNWGWDNEQVQTVLAALKEL